jgi:sialic acid synthase SpsE
MNKIAIGDKSIGQDQPAFIIAEVGINHNGSMKQAKKLVDEAFKSGASSVKFQTYITEKRVQKDAPIFDILKQCEIGFKDQEELFNYANEIGLVAFSTPFDEESVDFLSEINVPLFKVASFDTVNKPLLEKISETNTPTIVSRGMASESELDIAHRIFDDQNVPLAILHCISAYPIQNLDSINLSTMSYLRDRYECLVGFSDHTIGPAASICAVTMGAKVIEKHFTLDKNDDGPDHIMSADPHEMEEMISGIRNVETMIGKPVKGSIPEEQDILQYRRDN